MTIIKEHTCGSAEEFLQLLMPWSQETLEGYVFRGHASDVFKLVPSALRDDQQARDRLRKAAGMLGESPKSTDTHIQQMIYERRALHKFYQLADRRGLYVPHIPSLRRGLNDSADASWLHNPVEDRWLPESYVELAGLAQHYGVPTRLLDWTYDPLTAAYFASQGGIDAEFLSVWCLNMRRFDGITRLSLQNGIPLEFVTPFYGGNPNLAAQSGLFTHWISESLRLLEVFTSQLLGQTSLVNRRPLDETLSTLRFEGEPLDGVVFQKFRLPSKDAGRVRQLLKRAGYGNERLFPGYAGVVREIMSES